MLQQKGWQVVAVDLRNFSVVVPQPKWVTDKPHFFWLSSDVHTQLKIHATSTWSCCARTAKRNHQMILTLKNPCRSGVRMGWNMRVDYALTNYYIKKSSFGSSHACTAVAWEDFRYLQLCSMFVRIKESLLFLSGINPLFTSSCHIQSSNSVVWLIFSTKILCKMMLWAFSFYHESSMALPPQLADECFMVFFSLVRKENI